MKVKKKKKEFVLGEINGYLVDLVKTNSVLESHNYTLFTSYGGSQYLDYSSYKLFGLNLMN